MSVIYLGRQPILNRNRKTVAYELLYRSGTDNAFPPIGSTEATARVLHHLFTSIGLDEVAGGKYLFINFDRRLMLADLPDLGYKNVVFEILEDCVIDDALVGAVKRLVKKGFRIALDDFLLSKNVDRLLPLASIVKIDWLADSYERIREITSYVSRFNVKLLAEKIEDEKAFRQALDLGFEFFQGFFFAKPEIIQGKSVEVSSISRMNMLEILNRPDVEIDEIADAISADVSLVFKLLKIINSSLYGLRREVTSVSHAVSLLGIKEIKRWLFVLLLSEIGKGSPYEVTSLSVVRSLFSHRIASGAGNEEIADEAFLTGLFSLLDVMLKAPFSSFIADLPVSRDIKQALLEKQGELYPYIALCSAYEQCDMANVDRWARHFGMDVDDITINYLDAMRDSYRALSA